MPLITSGDLDELQKWLKRRKITYLDSHMEPHMGKQGELRDLKWLQEAFDAFANSQWYASIELPMCSYVLKHQLEKKMPHTYCSTQQAVLASLLYGCMVDFGPKTLRDSFTPQVFR